MDKTVQYTIITNKEYSFPNCINKLAATLKDDTTDNKRTFKRQKKMPTLRKIKRAATRHKSQRLQHILFCPYAPKPTHHPKSGRLTI